MVSERCGDAVDIRRFDESMEAQLLRFIGSWSEYDAYERFGSAGTGGKKWLTTRLTQHRHEALIAVKPDGVVGLLDYLDASGTRTFGIVVASHLRNCGIGTALIRVLLELRPASPSIVVECGIRNYAAIALLRACKFTPIARDPYQIIWAA